MKTLPNLYKDVTSEKGKVTRRVWKCKIYNNQYITYSGTENGKLIPKITKCSPKNIGRANETSTKEQIEKEAKAKWTKMVKRQLYKENPDDGVPPLYIQPMLALDYSKASKRLKWQENKFCVQPKLNGVRFIARKENDKVVLRSRKGKVYSVPHIEKELEKYINEGLIIDGELYLHNTELGNVASAVKNKDNPDHSNIEAHIFDLAIPDTTFYDRHTALHIKNIPRWLHDKIAARHGGGLGKESEHIKIVGTIYLDNMNGIDAWHDKFIKEGYEGLIIRDKDSHYAFGQRSTGLFKYKKFKDSEFKIVGVGNNKDETEAILLCETKKGKAFHVRCKGTNEYRKKQWDDRKKLIGKMLTVRYQSIFKTGIPEFPIGICIRDYE